MIIAQTRDIYSISIGRLNSLDWHQCTESIIRPLRPTQWWTSSCPCEPCPLGWEPAVGHEGQRCHEAGWQQWENPSLYHKPRGPTKTQRQGKRFNSAYCNISSLSQVKDTMMLTLMKTNMWYWSHHEKGGNSKKKNYHWHIIISYCVQKRTTQFCSEATVSTTDPHWWNH